MPEPIDITLHYFVQRQHPEKDGFIQVEGFVTREEAAEKLTTWHAERPDLHPYLWQRPILNEDAMPQPEPDFKQIARQLVSQAKATVPFTEGMVEFEIKDALRQA